MRNGHGPTVNAYHVIAIQPVYWRLQKTQLPLLLRVGPCLQSCCLLTCWSNPLHYPPVISPEFSISLLSRMFLATLVSTILITSLTRSNHRLLISITRSGNLRNSLSSWLVLILNNNFRTLLQSSLPMTKANIFHKMCALSRMAVYILL
jgi:hypothetical protein